MPLDALVSTLAGSIEPGLPTFVLIDPMLGEPLPVAVESLSDARCLNIAREQAWTRNVQRVELSPRIDLPAHQHPYLVEMRATDDPWLIDSMRMAMDEHRRARADGLAGSGCAPHRIGGWIQSSLDPQALSDALAGLMRVNTQAHTAARYQRLADRRVLAWLRHVVGDAQIEGTLGRLRSWRYVDALGQLAELVSPTQAAGTAEVRLSRSEWAEFMRGELVHPTVARWLGEVDSNRMNQDAPARFDVPSDVSAAYAQAARALEQAQLAAHRWPRRFTVPADRTAWAALALLHADIAHRAEVVAVLDATPESEEPIDSIDVLSAQLNAICQKGTP